MQKGHRGARALSLGITLALMVVAFYSFVRPWYLNWGATEEEQRKTLPGDEILTTAAAQQTRAITIAAPAYLVWPWLAQLGQDRGGFYSFDLLENLVGCEMPTTDAKLFDKQSWQLGDKLWMYPKDKAGGAGFATLRSYIPERALGFATRSFGTRMGEPENGSWAIVLEPVAAGTTRLLIRGRGAPGRSLLGLTFDRSLFEPVHFLMERRMMIGIKRLTETGDRGRLSNHVQLVLWAITFVTFIIAAIMVMRSRAWLRPFLGFVAAGVVFQVLTLGQPPAAVGLTLVWMVLAILWWPRSYQEPSTPRVTRSPTAAR